VKYFGGDLGRGAFAEGSRLYDETATALEGYRSFMERMEFSRALGSYWTIVQRANRFIEEERPWDLAKDPAKRDGLREVLRELVAVLWTTGRVLSPFMPLRMGEMLAQLKAPAARIDELPPAEVTVAGLTMPRPLFPRMEGDPDTRFAE
jgi:methionyl-tRNA synthetase